MSLVTAQEAAEYLGVKVSTIYSYVSRGLLRSTEAAGNSKQNRYYLEDLEKLKSRADARRGHGPAAASAVRFGPPIIETSITNIKYAGPVYRGIPAKEMIDEGWGFQTVADHLLESSFEFGEPSHAEAAKLSFDKLFDELGRQISSQNAEDIEPGKITASVLGEFISASAESEGMEYQFARPLAVNLGLSEPSTRHLEVVRRALIFLADHDLNTSTLAVRCCASTGASIAHALMSGLSTFCGPKHGLAPTAILDWLEDRNPLTLHDDELTEDVVRWFDHPLYPEGLDPRAKNLILYMDEHELFDQEFDKLIRRIDDNDFGYPSMDLVLAAIEQGFGLRKNAGALLFAVARMIGWTAHYVEQSEQNFLIRPRAEFRALGK